jgi:hypothetical protein
MPFIDSLDIANRALQHVGGNPILDVNEDSQNNLEVANAYDKVRRAELRRNVWRFAVRKAALRPVDDTTLQIVPALYDATRTYLLGEIVRDQNGQFWISEVANNFNQLPGGNNDAWESYFGPLSVSPFDATTSYLAGELVYIQNAQTNLFINSQALEKNGWFGTFLTVTPNATTAPDGSQTAEKLVDGVQTNQHNLSQTLGSVAIGTVYTLSVYAKAGERTILALTGFGEAYSFFDLVAGVVINPLANKNPTITSVGNGWFRCSVTITKSNTNGQFFFLLSTGYPTINYAGDGVSGLYLWGAQLDAGATLQPYNATPPGGAYSVYLSLTSGNSDQPNVGNSFDSTVTYGLNDVTRYAGIQWRSLIPLNIGNTPTDGPAAFDPTATYSTGQRVAGSDNYIYSSIGSGNKGYDPVTDGGAHWQNTNLLNAWSRTPTLPLSATSWRPISATLQNITTTYPVGFGPDIQSQARNIYRLPAGYLRMAPQYPKVPTAWLGGSSGRVQNDWDFDGDFIVTMQSDPIVLRFVADITKVLAMDDMFCEGLAARVAIAVAPRITQSEAKLGTIASAYQKFMSEARLVNAIEEGPDDPPDDEFITVRY